ncbi:MAG: hypothetical protein WC863_03620 [Patescibacteria group bacterium]
MKKFSLLSVFVALLAFFSIGCSSTPLSYMGFGQKSSGDIQKTIDILTQEINNYESKIKKLRVEEGELQELADRDSVLGNKVLVNRAGIIISENDSLVRFYQTKVGELTEKINSLLTQSTMEDDYVRLTGDNPSEIAGAYMNIKYLSQGNRQDSLIGIIENANPNVETLSVEVSNSFGFHVYFILDNKDNRKSPEFVLPTPGWYTITCRTQGRYEGQSRSLSMKVAPGVNYYDGGKKYALKATLRP